MRKDTSRCSFIFECRNTSSRQSSRHTRDVYLKSGGFKVWRAVRKTAECPQESLRED